MRVGVMAPRSRRGEDGWILPIALFALALLLAIVNLLSSEAIDTLHIVREIGRSERLHSAIASTIRDSSASSSRCGTITISGHEHPPSYEVCHEPSLPFVTLPASAQLPAGRVDYDALFTQASACSSTTTPTAYRDTTSPFAQKDCTLPPTLTGSVVIRDNIRGDALTFERSVIQSATLATPGRVIISEALLAPQELLILSGGEVRIGTLRAPPFGSAKVTIISALGAIRVGTVEGNVALLIAGRGAIEAPETQTAENFPLPPFRKLSLYSFRPSS